VQPVKESVEPWLLLAPAVGLWAAIIASRARKRARMSRQWLTTKGIVTESKFVKGGRNGDVAFVTYLYFTPEERRGSGLGPGGSMVADPAAVVRRFPKGQEVLVRYDPNNPNDSFLESGAQVPISWFIFLAVVGIGFPVIYFVWVALLNRSGT